MWPTQHPVCVWLHYRQIRSIKRLCTLTGLEAPTQEGRLLQLFLHTCRTREVTEGKQRCDGVGATGMWADVGPMDVTVH